MSELLLTECGWQVVECDASGGGALLAAVVVTRHIGIGMEGERKGGWLACSCHFVKRCQGMDSSALVAGGGC